MTEDQKAPRTSQNVDEVIKRYKDAKSRRMPLERDWRTTAAHCLPSEYDDWGHDGPTQRQDQSSARRVSYDTTGARALQKYTSLLERLATPTGQRWQMFMPSDPNLKNNRRVRLFFDALQNEVFRQRYAAPANFRSSVNEMYQSMGVYGNGPIFIGQRRVSIKHRTPGFKYKSLPFRDCFVLLDDEGDMYGFVRRYWLTPMQFKLKFGDGFVPPSIAKKLENASSREADRIEFIHFVALRDEATYDPEALDARSRPYFALDICVEDKVAVREEEGFASMPYKMPRPASVSGNPYGYGPAIMALTSMGGASAMKRTNLKQGNKAVDPPLLVHDDGIMNGPVDVRPGGITPGGVDAKGNMMVRTLPMGDFRVAENLLSDERNDIEDCFFVTLFQILTENPRMTATEVNERMAEKAALLAPTMGRLQHEALGPMTEREIDVLVELGRLPEMPPELLEARGEYDIEYTSPLAKGMYAEDINGFLRAWEIASTAAQTTGDPSPLDRFNLDVALPEIADHLSTPTRWMNDDETVAEIRQGRAEQAEQAQLLQNASGLAAAARTASEVTQ